MLVSTPGTNQAASDQSPTRGTQPFTHIKWGQLGTVSEWLYRCPRHEIADSLPSLSKGSLARM